MRFHPGGQKILLVNAGTDATEEYNIIGHNQDQQIEAMLMSCKVGVVAAPPEFKNIGQEKVYNKIISCLEALTKLENRLSIANNLFLNDPAGYLWRKSLMGFFGKNSDGSFQYSLRIFEEICQLAGMPEQDFSLFYQQLSQIAVSIFEKSQTAKEIDEHLQLRRIYEVVASKTTEFVSKMKELIGNIAHDFETNSPEVHKLNAALAKTSRLVRLSIDSTKHLYVQLGIKENAANKQVLHFKRALVKQ
jgi:hypothetical protein